MSREKQIEEMAKVLCKNALTEYCASGRCTNQNCLVNAKALETLYNAGYRKQSDVAREIFDDIEGVRIRYALGTISKGALNSMLCYYKAKYTEGKT